MTTSFPWSGHRRVIIGRRSYDIRFETTEIAAPGTVVVTLDGQYEWVTEVVVWSGISFGATGDLGYLWSARELVVLPHDGGSELEVIRFEDDVHSVFREGVRWVVVCETSVHLVIGDLEAGRVELSDVVVAAAWDDDALEVRDFGGHLTRFTIRSRSLIVETSEEMAREAGGLV